MPKLSVHKPCKVANCNLLARKAGYCNKHYLRDRRRGHPLAGGTFRGEPKRYLEEVVIPFDEDVCLIWAYGSTNGYPSISVDGKTRPAIRIICERRWGPPPTPKHEAAHKCNVRMCCAPRHLRWATVKENQADRIGHGTMIVGSAHRTSKLKEGDINQIRALKEHLSEQDIGKLFGVSRGAINAILRGITWKHVLTESLY